MRIDEADAVIEGTAQQNEACRRLVAIPGIGPVTATARIAGIAERFQNVPPARSSCVFILGMKLRSAERTESPPGFCFGSRLSALSLRHNWVWGRAVSSPTIDKGSPRHG